MDKNKIKFFCSCIIILIIYIGINCFYINNNIRNNTIQGTDKSTIEYNTTKPISLKTDNHNEPVSEVITKTTENTENDLVETLSQKNARKSAESYIKYSDFSYSGLVHQLQYEGYSTENAEYGANNCGADWLEEAAGCANSYLSYSSFSKAGLTDQLRYEGFTEEQIEYALNAVGY